MNKKERKFVDTVWTYYKDNGRHTLPWRATRYPYKILVSEIMLQQTQVDRVIFKYKSFLKRFPTVQKLAQADTKSLLLEWQGLGYNRRAVNLKRTAETIVNEYKGKFPTDLETLLKLPGIGKATAGDLLAFAWNKPSIVIETNIRTVFIHHFFKNQEKISDTELIPLIEKTLDKEHPREWYYALMDYGSFLKKQMNINARSAQYKKQSAFKGSNRELRSTILKLVLEKGRTEQEILDLLNSPAPAISKNLIALEKEGLIQKKGKKFI